MRCSILARSGALAIAAAVGLFGADAVRWGAAVDGLQLGIAIGSKPEPTLRVILKNVSASVQVVPMGFEEEPDPPYNMILTARDARQHEIQVFDTIAAKYKPSEDRGAARNLRLDPGAVREFVYRLDQLICVVHMTDISLDKLLPEGYTVRAAFGFRQRAVASPDISFKAPKQPQ